MRGSTSPSTVGKAPPAPCACPIAARGSAQSPSLGLIPGLDGRVSPATAAEPWRGIRLRSRIRPAEVAGRGAVTPLERVVRDLLPPGLGQYEVGTPRCHATSQRIRPEAAIAYRSYSARDSSSLNALANV